MCVYFACKECVCDSEFGDPLFLSLASLAASIASIIMTVLYHILRPKDTFTFRQWWRRGRWVVMFIFFSAAAAVVGALAQALFLVSKQYFVSLSSEGICDIVNLQGATASRYREGMVGGLGFFGVFTLLSILLML